MEIWNSRRKKGGWGGIDAVEEIKEKGKWGGGDIQRT